MPKPSNKRKSLFEKALWARSMHRYKAIGVEYAMEKSYLEALLAYVNSREYATTKYKEDAKMYEADALVIDSLLKKIEGESPNSFIVFRAKNTRRLPGLRLKRPLCISELRKEFAALKKVYAKKPGQYVMEDVELLNSRFWWDGSRHPNGWWKSEKKIKVEIYNLKR